MKFSSCVPIAAGLAALLACAAPARADHIQLVPNPEGVTYSKFAFIYRDQLYAVFGTQLGRVEGDDVTLFDNPSAKDTGFAGPTIEWRGKMYFVYQDAEAHRWLAEFDGQAIKLVAGPAPGSVGTAGFQGYPVIFRDRLFWQFQDAQRVAGTLTEFDGSGLKFFRGTERNPGYVGIPVVFHDRLCIVYQSLDQRGTHLALFDGAGITVVPNPDGGNGVQRAPGVEPFVLNGKLVEIYNDAAGLSRLAEYDGNTLRLVPLPPGAGYVYRSGDLILNGKLILQLLGNAPGFGPFAMYDGVQVTPLPANFDLQGMTRVSLVTVTGGKLFISSADRLATYDGSRVEIFPVGFSGKPIEAMGKLFLVGLRRTNPEESDVGELRDGKITPLPAVHPGKDESASDAFVFHRNLYFRYGVRSGSAKLGYVVASAPPPPRPKIAFGVAGNRTGSGGVLDRSDPAALRLTFLDVNGEKQSFVVGRPKSMNAGGVLDHKDDGGWVYLAPDKQSGFLFNLQPNGGVTVQPLAGIMLQMMSP